MVLLRILQVYMGPYLADKGGGVSVYVRNISERLAKRHDVTVFATNLGGLPNFEVVNGVKVERFSRFAPGGAYSFSLGMLLRLRKAEFDVVHGHCYHAFPMHFSALAKCKKFVVSTHFHGAGHSAFRNSLIKLFRPIGNLALKKADSIITVSEYEKTLLVNQFNIDSDSCTVIPAGVDFSEFVGLNRRERGFRSVLYVGRLEAYKGVQYLLQALPELPNDVVLKIVGDGHLKNFLKEMTNDLDIGKRVSFYNGLPRRELLQLFVDAEVFVLPSRYEAYSLVVAEALAAGTPCVVANSSALKEWIDGETCFGVDHPITPEKLAKAIITVLDRGVRGNVISEKWVGNKILSWDEVVYRLEDLYFR